MKANDNNVKKRERVMIQEIAVEKVIRAKSTNHSYRNVNNFMKKHPISLEYVPEIMIQ